MTIELLPFFIGCAVRASVLLGFAWGLTAVMRRASAATRHFVWACAIAAAAFVPVAMATLPSWRLPSPAALMPLAFVIAPSVGDVVVMPASEPAPADRDAALSDPSATSVSRGRVYMRIAANVWAAGTTGVFVYLFVGFLLAWRLQRSATCVEPRWAAQAQALARSLDMRGPIAFGESAKAAVPIACGFWRPAIVLPEGAWQWPQERRRSVLLHELAHIKRRDYLTHVLAQCMCAAYWFNPLAWIANRCLRVERERACDDVVLATGTKGSDYARHLVEIARARQTRWLPAAAGLSMGYRSQLETRLIAILDPRTRRASPIHARLAVLATVLLMSIPIAAVQPARVTAVGQTTDFQWSGSLAQGETIEVRGFSGSIRTITSTDGLIRVEARISNPARVRIDVMEREAGITICTVVSTPHGDQSECQPGRRAESAPHDEARVDFVVHVPADVRFAGSMVYGDIEIDGVRSDVSVATINGDVTLKLPHGHGADFQGNLISGTIESDFPVHDSTPPLPSGARAGGPDGPRIVRARIGNGGAALRVATINGNIRLRQH